MIETILSSLIVYIATSIDYFIILLVVFAGLDKDEFKQVMLGQYLGTGILVGVSLLAAYVLNLIPEDWIIGLLGLIPLYLGIRLAIYGEDEEEEEMAERVQESDSNRLFWIITLITIAAGGDNLGIYIPYFTSLTPMEIVVMLIVFTLSVFVLTYLSYRLAKVNVVSETIENYERIIVPIVFIGLGIYILLESGTIQYLIQLIT